MAIQYVVSVRVKGYDTVQLPLLNVSCVLFLNEYTVLVNKEVLKNIFEGKVAELMQNNFLACVALRSLEQL